MALTEQFLFVEMVRNFFFMSSGMSPDYYLLKYLRNSRWLYCSEILLCEQIQSLTLHSIHTFCIINSISLSSEWEGSYLTMS